MSGELSAGTRAQLACILEATARKPGNVHRYLDFDDATYLDFLVSAVAVGQAFDRSCTQGVGAMILDAVESTLQLVPTNTNLGLILLLAPLALAFEEDRTVEAVLAATTVDDSRLVYRAIRRAAPAGLGRVAEQDVADEPVQTLREVMGLAAERDLVARQYVNAFAEVRSIACTTIRESLARGLPQEAAVILSFLRLLAANPDTLIARKRGWDEARRAQELAARVLDAGWPEGDLAVRRIRRLDRWLRAERHSRNPGTSADLVAAGLFVCLCDGTIQSPVTGGRSGWSATGL